MDWQRGQICIITGQHDFLRRRLGARDLEHFGFIAQSPLEFRQQVAGRNAESARDARTAASYAAYQFVALRAYCAEQDRARIAFEGLGDVGEIDRLIANVELVTLC